MGKTKSGFYVAVTGTGSTITRTWDEILSFLKEHPGKEFHKKFPTEEQAVAFMQEKLREFGGAAIPAKPVVPPTSECTIIAPNTEEEDASPPW
ncbi:viroplasmin family protein [uncultured Duncaniella sp.]|uniref:viroplasmin family protein n=1 Tax=uncultured Duncaniella sp. TaxID=2768039 RepID=UPI0025A9BF8F|nr:viroplasmin family protein [uncultured Duncaniella sp.]